MLSSVHQPRDGRLVEPDDATTTRSSSIRYRIANMSAGSPAYGTLVGLCAFMHVQRVGRQVHRVQDGRGVGLQHLAERVAHDLGKGRAPSGTARGRAGTVARCRSSPRSSPRARAAAAPEPVLRVQRAVLREGGAVAHEGVAVLEPEREPRCRAAEVDERDLRRRPRRWRRGTPDPRARRRPPACAPAARSRGAPRRRATRPCPSRRGGAATGRRRRRDRRPRSPRPRSSAAGRRGRAGGTSVGLEVLAHLPVAARSGRRRLRAYRATSARFIITR